MPKNENALILETVSETASFRIPEFHNYHKSLPLPPVTTIVGLVGAALGLSNEDAQSFFSNRTIKMGIYGQSRGHYTDLWKAMSSKKGVRDTVIKKEFHYRNKYKFVFISDDKTIGELELAFKNPSYPTVIGSSDSLLKIVKVVKEKNPAIFQTNRFENCVLMGDYLNSIQIDLDKLELGKTYQYTPITAPQVYNLPIGFDFQSDGVRKIKKRAEMTFIGMIVKSEKSLPAIKYKNSIIPVFDHCP
ncbi:CRISPR-associated protein Cas5 [candidate division KSB1 bacterium]|nr:CRISPR-associated protein Cas5 [candidate division KSB1 bacterium]